MLQNLCLYSKNQSSCFTVRDNRGIRCSRRFRLHRSWNLLLREVTPSNPKLPASMLEASPSQWWNFLLSEAGGSGFDKGGTSGCIEGPCYP